MNYQVVRSYVVYRNPRQIQVLLRVRLNELFHAKQCSFFEVCKVNYAKPQEQQARARLQLHFVAEKAPD